jgi:hypothetical protein
LRWTAAEDAEVCGVDNDPLVPEVGGVELTDPFSVDGPDDAPAAVPVVGVEPVLAVDPPPAVGEPEPVDAEEVADEPPDDEPEPELDEDEEPTGSADDTP